MINQQSIENNLAQGIASYIDHLNNIRLTDLTNKLEVILNSETDKLSNLVTKSENALSNLDWAKIEIDNLINTNRGGEKGIHGFISEFAETGIRNAKYAFQEINKSVKLLNNNGPVDILLENKEVQMKFYIDIVKEIKESSKYENMSMMFPKDHVEVIEKIMSGAKNVEFNGNMLTNSKINDIKKAIEDESFIRGASYEKWLNSSVLKYKDVQKGTIEQTLAREVNDINRQTTQEKLNIKKDINSERLKVQQETQASFGEASKVAGIGTVVQGGFNFGIFVYQKHKSGKNLWDFDIEDWKECGISTVKGAAKGGISGYSIYGLTNICNLAAPSAGAITSGTFGLSNAIIKYRKGDIDTDGFIDLVMLNAIDATGAAIGAAIGQMIIPIPVAGALVGSIIATTALSIGKGILNKQEIKEINLYQEKITKFVSELDEIYQVKLDELLNKYHKLGELQEYSFDFNINVHLRFISSINLANLVGVSEKDILKNEDEIDQYFLG